jgi:catechol 2,3-dioxygenase-like lactoylglutathione lyase family enzyme
MSVPDPWKAAEFYIGAFGMTKVGETDSSLAQGVYLSDGIVNLALLKYKTDQAAGEDRGKDFVGIHHVGFWVEDLDGARENIEAVGGTYMMGEAPVLGNSFYEIKYRDPNGVVIDITQAGWGGASKDGTTPGPKLRHEGLKVRQPAE